MIEQDIYDHLRNETLGNTSDSTRQAARLHFRDLAGKAVYLGRIRAHHATGTPPTPPIGVFIRKLNGGNQYDVVSEHPTAQPIVEVTIVGRDDSHAKQVLDIAEAVRLIFSGYVGFLGVDDTYVQGCTVEAELSLPPQLLGDGGDRWSHAAVIDLRFTINQHIAA